MKYLYILLIIMFINASAFSQQTASDEDAENPQTQPQTKKAALIVLFLYDSNQEESVSNLIELGKELEITYQNKVELQFVNINENEMALNIWESLKHTKSAKYNAADVICILNDRFIIGLHYIKQLLPEFIDFELNPKTAFDPLTKKIVRTQIKPLTEQAPKPADKTDWEAYFSIFLTLLIIVVTLVLGLGLGFLIFRKKK